jgi:hypothetical protein
MTSANYKTPESSLDRLGPGTIAMSDAAAQGRHIGDTVQVTLGDGIKSGLAW